MRRKGERYYYDAGGKPRKWIPLGPDLNEARRRWAELEGQEVDPTDKTFRIIAQRYEREVIPTKAPRTQKDNGRQMAKLLAVFGSMPIDEIRPVDVVEYLRIRGAEATVQANREKALLSHLFNHARAWGYTNAPNPCAGVKGHKETGRDRYVSDDEYQAVWNAADQVTRDAMDLALLTGQRPGDVLKMTRSDVFDGALHVRQNKTGKRLAIELTGDLAEVVARILTRKTISPHLVADEQGQRLTEWSLRYRFDAARDAAGVHFQFRDIRAKSGTDASQEGGMDRAQKLLGHKHQSMTQHYVRARKGERIKPLR